MKHHLKNERINNYAHKLTQIRSLLELAKKKKQMLNLNDLDNLMKNLQDVSGNITGCAVYARSVLIKHQYIIKSGKCLTWNSDKNQQFEIDKNVLAEEILKYNSKQNRKKSNLKTTNDIIHQPMLFDSVMREENETRPVLIIEKQKQLYKLIGELFIELSQLNPNTP